MSEITNYTEAFKELEEIVSQLEEGNISVDELSTKIKRASELIAFCRKKLSSTEVDVNKILQELEK